MAQGLRQSDLDTAVDQAIATGSEDAFAFLERLVAQPSVLGEEAGAQQLLAAALGALGFTIEWLPIPAELVGDPLAGVPPLAYDGSRRVLVARRSGHDPSAGRSLLINGHLDVVPGGDPGRWVSEPFSPQRRDGWLHGRGAGDMKSGWAMVVLALGALRDAGRDPAGDLVVVGAIEEECGGNGTLASVRAGIGADAVLLPEPTDLEILVRGAGILWVDILVEGSYGHAGEADSGASAIDAAYTVIAALRALATELEHGAAAGVRYPVNVGMLSAGEWPSSVPGSARLRVRVGFPRELSPAAMITRVGEAVATAALDTRLGIRTPRVVPSGFRAEGYALDPGDPLVIAVAQAHADVHGAPPEVVGTNATTDARYYLNQAGIPALCYGPRTRGMHGVDEAVQLDSIVAGARTLTRFLDHWLNTTP